MIVRPKARELIVGVADDPTFGPVIVFGQGGTAVEVIDDKALALPPLDLALARDLIARTRVSRILKAYRNVPAADERAIALLLVKLAQLAADFSEDPRDRSQSGARRRDRRDRRRRPRCRSRRSSRAAAAVGHPRFAIRPYPKEWERHLTLPDGTALLVRPVRPEDEAAVSAVLRRRHAAGSAPALLRAGEGIQPCLHRALHPDRLRARHGVHRHRRGERRDARRRAPARRSPITRPREYAILVRSDLKGHGLGWLLMQLIIEYARAEGIELDSRPSAARERHDAGHVPQARLSQSRPIRRIRRSSS